MDMGFSMLSVGFTLGLLHAFDADHVMAVSAMSSGRPGFWRTLRFSANWALGHSGVLILAGLLLFGLGLAIPESLVHGAEIMVGFVLIGIGLACFRRFYRQGVTLKTHRHGDVVHTHWQLHDHDESRAEKSGRHTPVMVGMLHGLAGSAPALALVPAVAQGNLIQALLYLLLFSAGVMLSMLLLGSALGSAQNLLKQRSVKVFNGFRYAIAGASVVLGGVWLVQAI